MSDSIYNADFLQTLFDEMQDTYERVSNITSFGFNLRWRRQLVEMLNLQEGMVVADLMGGSGETWRYILPYIGKDGQLTNIDFSQAMCDYAVIRRQHLDQDRIQILKEDVLGSSIPDQSIDAVICVYGVKTLSPDLYDSFALEIQRILKPRGVFGVVEISVPSVSILRLPYMFYLSQIVPLIGSLLLGNHENYRLLSRYMSAFQNCKALTHVFEQHQFQVEYHRFFFGSCTAIIGNKQAKSVI